MLASSDIVVINIYLYKMPTGLLLFGSGSGQGLGSTVQSVSVVSSELGVDTLKRRVLVGSGLLDPVSVGLSGLVVGGVVLRLSHLDRLVGRFSNKFGQRAALTLLVVRFWVGRCLQNFPRRGWSGRYRVRRVRMVTCERDLRSITLNCPQH